MGAAPYRGCVDTCVRCGAELGVGRFCLNCGHPIGAPVPAMPQVASPVPTPAVVLEEPPEPEPDPAEPEAVEPEARVSESMPAAVPVQAADPTPVPPTPRAAGTALDVDSERDPEWDPELDLLPYHEVDELEPEAPLTGRAWLIWVAGALALVALVLVLLQVFDSDPVDETGTGTETGTGQSAGQSTAAPSDETPPDEASGDSAEEAPQGVGERLDLADTATFTVPDTAPPTQDLDGNLVAYDASQMGDGNPATTWRTAGDASGQSITIALAQAGVINRVGLVNGYAKQVAGVDWYPNNRRILSATWSFDDGSSVEQTFAERPAMQLLKVPPVRTSTVTLTITSVTPPGNGPLGRDYTAISEVTLVGRAAA